MDMIAKTYFWTDKHGALSVVLLYLARAIMQTELLLIGHLLLQSYQNTARRILA